MPDVTDHMRFAYPFLFDEADDRFAAAETLQWAQGIAAGFRPSCLPDDLQNLAQAHYAAYLIAARQAAQSVFGATTGAGTVRVAGPITERVEGGVTVRYGTGSASSSTGTVASGDPGPSAPYAAWAALAAMCGPVAGVAPPKYRGGIIVRSNPVIV